MDTVARLDALESIRFVQASYWRYKDTKQWDLLRTVFTDFAEADYPGDRGGTARGADAVVSFIRDRVGSVQTVHHGHAPEITFQSDTTASGIWPFEDLL